jgi:hypothetical protein
MSFDAKWGLDDLDVNSTLATRHFVGLREKPKANGRER